MNEEQRRRYVMTERFAKDTLLSLATLDGGRPSVRTVDAVYEDGSFYAITYALSGKMKQIEAEIRSRGQRRVVYGAGRWGKPRLALRRSKRSAARDTEGRLCRLVR